VVLLGGQSGSLAGDHGRPNEGDMGGVTPKVMCPWEKNDSKMTPVTCVHSACACHFFRRSVKNQKIEMILGPQSDSQSVTKSHQKIEMILTSSCVCADVEALGVSSTKHHRS
jgi:hypothetical protein